ncbi:hypothetical protein [Microcoleus sp. B9-D4]|uniref:hypothetical protein n=1 Tax=Microcoleus sp. B9-D4 TaxID=2818711 RepID=UPI002FD36656
MSNNEKSASQVAEELVSVTNGFRLGAGETILSVRVSEPEQQAASTTKKPSIPPPPSVRPVNIAEYSAPRTPPITPPPSVRPPTPGNIADRTG